MARWYQERQRQSDGRWDFTISSDDEGWAHAAGYCGGWPWGNTERLKSVLSPEQIAVAAKRCEPFKANYHIDGHATPEAARACYRQYQLDMELRFYADNPQATVQERCRFCGEWTSGAAQVGTLYHWPLCVAHRVRLIVEGLMK